MNIDVPPMTKSATVAPAQTLQDDVLSLIFSYTIPSNLLSDNILEVSPLNVSMVCRSWRVVAVQTATLWASLSIEFPMEQETTDARCVRHFTEMWMKRSSTASLDINLSHLWMTTSPEAYEIHEIIYLVFSEASRWREVDIIARLLSPECAANTLPPSSFHHHISPH